MRVVVTGGAGFIGRWVTALLLAEGHEVMVLDNFSTGSPHNLQGLVNRPALAVVEGDVADPDDLGRAFATLPDVCIHLAARINVHESLQNPLCHLRENEEATVQLLERCRRARSRFVLVSSCMVYAPAPPGRALRETDATAPASPYAASKLNSEHWTLAYARAYGLDTCVLRPFNTYGPYQRADQEGGVVSVFLRALLSGESLRLFGDGTQTRDLLYVEDCARFIVRAALEPRATGMILHAGSGREVAIRDLARQIAGQDGLVTHVPHPHPHSEIQRLVADNSLARSLLGWSPRWDLRSGLQATLEFLRREVDRR